MLAKLEFWNKKLIDLLQKKLCDLVVSFPTQIRIKGKDIIFYLDMLTP